MLNHDVNFEFIGFDPDHEVRGFLALAADRFHSLAPSDSFMKVAMKKGGNAIEASCRIASKAGVFVADAVCSSPVATIHQIENKIRQQLDEWKRHRFLDSRNKLRPSRPHLEIAI